MRCILKYMKVYTASILFSMILKLFGTLAELTLPYILEYMIDEIVPKGKLDAVMFWGTMMILTAILCWVFNILANRKAVENAHNISFDIRKALFDKTINLSGIVFDEFGLPSLTSRMTSDSYNVQSFVQSFQTIFVRAPIMLCGGIIMTMAIDSSLSMILCIMVPILIFVVLGVSYKGIPLYNKVQDSLDTVTRVLRENITGIRVIKALSKEKYEINRFSKINEEMTQKDIKANGVMAIPGPFMQLCLNIGLTLVVIIGAYRVNDGLMKAGVILAFLTYFNLIMQSVMALNRIFIMLSKASASADRIARVLVSEKGLEPVENAENDSSNAFIHFDHVNFSYSKVSSNAEKVDCLHDIDFEIKKGGSLGIIGPTGSGKTTIINLLMRFYDCDNGSVYVEGKDVRTYDLDALRKKFGVVFQNDIVFNNTLLENIRFGRKLTEEEIMDASKDAQAYEFISNYKEGLHYKADIKGANLSGGQKQRVLISRALADKPEILVLDDSSSALDYETDSKLRKVIREKYTSSTIIMIAQRISSIQNCDEILVLDGGKCIGKGTHEELLKNCPYYKSIYDSQMGTIL